MALPGDMIAFNRMIVEEFRANEGEIADGMLKGSRLCLLTTTGARTGERRTTPLAYLQDGPGRIVLWASNMAAPRHPGWYHNLVANPDVFVEFKTDAGVESFEAVASTAEGGERERLLALLETEKPEMAAHQSRTERVIPLVVCERVATG